MITPAPSRNSNFNADYDHIGAYVTDDSRIPYYNPSDSDVMYQPGEPMLVSMGPGSEAFMANAPIFPDEVSMLLSQFTADFPAVLTADVPVGNDIYWNTDTQVAQVGGDVTNGFVIGRAIWAIDPNIKNEKPTVDVNGRVLAGTTASTTIRVISVAGDAIVKGSVTPLALPTAKSSKSSK